ncbi:MAG: hypothetical protein HQL82_04255 [Magnetococcales bacterium]|nr:hypothetical protein [Magnetococcales bacterium]
MITNGLTPPAFWLWPVGLGEEDELHACLSIRTLSEALDLPESLVRKWRYGLAEESDPTSRSRSPGS